MSTNLQIGYDDFVLRVRYQQDKTPSGAINPVKIPIEGQERERQTGGWEGERQRTEPTRNKPEKEKEPEKREDKQLGKLGDKNEETTERMERIREK